VNPRLPLRRRPDALWRRSLDAIVILPPNEHDTIIAAGVAAEIWELLTEWRTADALVTLFADAAAASAAPGASTGASPSREEIDAVLAGFDEHGLLDHAPS
jgi:hypothetical protein